VASITSTRPGTTAHRRPFRAKPVLASAAGGYSAMPYLYNRSMMQAIAAPFLVQHRGSLAEFQNYLTLSFFEAAAVGLPKCMHAHRPSPPTIGALSIAAICRSIFLTSATLQYIRLKRRTKTTPASTADRVAAASTTPQR